MSDQEFTQFNNKLYAAFIAAHPGEEKEYVEFMHDVQVVGVSQLSSFDSGDDYAGIGIPMLPFSKDQFYAEIQAVPQA